MKQYIYADNAATTKLDIDAFEAMKPYLLEEFGNASQPYSFGKRARHAIQEARGIIADCINASPNEIFFTSGGTESDNWALKRFGTSHNTNTHIFTSEIEHHAVLNTCNRISETNCGTIHLLKVTREGIVLPQLLKESLGKISSSSTLVSIMFANNEIGTVQPIKALADVTHQCGSYFHTDAVQAIGHIRIDVRELKVDMLSASAHKFNGPKGIGFLYVKEGTPISSFHNGGSQETGMRAGTENVASIVGMAKALQINCHKINENMEHIASLELALIDRLNQANVSFIRNGAEEHIPGNISLSFKGFDGEAILHRLDLLGICVSTGSACDSVNTQISHVLKAIHLDDDYAKGTIRISLGKDSTLDDANCIADSIIKILKV